jgi:hypothetical protein
LSKRSGDQSVAHRKAVLAVKKMIKSPDKEGRFKKEGRTLAAASDTDLNVFEARFVKSPIR